MPASKPTSLAGVSIQTGHTNYANLQHVYSFLDGSGTTVTDSHGSANLTLTAGSGGWQTSTTPYGLTLDLAGGGTYCIEASPVTWTDDPGFVLIARFKCDSIEGTYPAAIVGGDKFGSGTPNSDQIGIFVHSDNTISCVCGVEGSAHYRNVTGIPYTLGTWVTIAMIYDYSGNSNAGTLVAYKDGVSSGTPATNGDRPGQFTNFETDLQIGRIGDANNDSAWSGEFDVLYVYNADLSEADVQAINNDIYAVISASGGGGGGGDWSGSAVIGDLAVEGLAGTLTIGGVTPAGKPNTLAAIDLQTGNPLYTNLRNLYSFLDGSGTTVTDSISGDNATVTFNSTGSWNTSTEPEGLDLKHAGSGAQDVVKELTITTPDEIDFSIHFRVKIDAWDGLGGDRLAIMGSKSFAGQGLGWLCDTSSGSPVLTMKLQDSAFQFRQVSGINVPVGEFVDLVMTYNYATGTLSGYLNGQAYAQETPTGDKPGQFGTIAGGLLINNTDDDDTQRGADMSCDVLHYWENRVLSQSEVTSISNEPHQLLGAGGTVGGWEGSAVIGELDAEGLAGEFYGVGFLSNDTGEQPITAIISQQPTLGTITDWTGDGSFTYQAGSTAGTDTIKYIASYGGSQPAVEETITITVNAPPGADFNGQAVIGEVAVTGLVGEMTISGVTSGNWSGSAVIGDVTVEGLAGAMTITGTPTADFNGQAVIGEVLVEGFAGVMYVGVTTDLGYINNPGVIAPAQSHIYNGYDNVFEFQLTEDGTVLDEIQNKVSKIIIEWKDQTLDSSITPAAFDFTQGNGRVIVKLGELGWPAGIDYARVIAFDSNYNDDGAVFADVDTEQRLKIVVE